MSKKNNRNDVKTEQDIQPNLIDGQPVNPPEVVPPAEGQEDASPAPEEKAGEVTLVKMVRDKELKPNTADVHPDEVENFQQGGWRLAEE